MAGTHPEGKQISRFRPLGEWFCAQNHSHYPALLTVTTHGEWESFCRSYNEQSRTENKIYKEFNKTLTNA